MTSETDTTDGSPEVEGDSNLNGNSLDQIREILFGNQSRTIDGQLQDLHDQLFDAVGNLRSLLTERADTLNRRIEQEVRVLHDELNEYRREQAERSESIDHKLNDATNDLRQQIGALRETVSSSEKSVREDMRHGFEELKNSLTQRMDEIREQMRQDVSQLSNATVKRRSLSDALKQLSAEFEDG